MRLNEMHTLESARALYWVVLSQLQVAACCRPRARYDIRRPKESSRLVRIALEDSFAVKGHLTDGAFQNIVAFWTFQSEYWASKSEHFRLWTSQNIQNDFTLCQNRFALGSSTTAWQSEMRHPSCRSDFDGSLDFIVDFNGFHIEFELTSLDFSGFAWISLDFIVDFNESQWTPADFSGLLFRLPTIRPLNKSPIISLVMKIPKQKQT